MAAERVLRLPPNHADQVARLLAWTIQDAGEGFSFGSGKYDDEVYALTAVAEEAADAAQAIMDLRQSRQTTAVDRVRKLAETHLAIYRETLGHRYYELLRVKAGKEDQGIHAEQAAGKEVDATALRAMMLGDVLDLIEALPGASDEGHIALAGEAS